MAEHRLCKAGVRGSIPLVSTTITAGHKQVLGVLAVVRDVPKEHASRDDGQDGDVAYQSLSGRYSFFS